MQTMALAPHHRDTFWQLVRYGLVGGVVTALYTAVYVGVDSLTHASVQVCNLAGYMAAVMLGYVLHSRVTFRNHGARGRGSQLRFLAASLPNLALNGFWSWLLAVRLGLPHWTVQVPVWFVTPFLIFAINRWWVFR